jgi:putative chitinase
VPALGEDLVNKPELLGEPALACRSAAWFWRAHGCNELADAGKFEAITKTINGGLNGYAERIGLWESAKEAIT